MHKRSQGFIPPDLHNRRYEGTSTGSKPIDFPAEMQKAFEEATKRQIARVAKKLPLPDYRGYPVATPHGLRRFA